MLFDSHSHLHLPQFDTDREEIIKKLRDNNVKTINVGTDFEESGKAVELSKKYPDILCASVGLHPNDVFKENFNVSKYKELAEDDSVVAIGECGLDYYRIETNDMGQETRTKNKQKEIFIQQIELARELNKPLILHCRPSVGTQDAYENVLDIIENFPLKADQSMTENIPTVNGVAHFFSGSKETAQKFLDLGFYISFAGPITFHPTGDHPEGGANPYKELVKFVPLNRILIETDSPFAAPLPYRGERNEPAFVEFVARKIAEWKELDFDKVATQTHNNAKDLFKI